MSYCVTYIGKSYSPNGSGSDGEITDEVIQDIIRRTYATIFEEEYPAEGEENAFSRLRKDVDGLRSDVDDLKNSAGEMQNDINELKSDVDKFNHLFDSGDVVFTVVANQPFQFDALGFMDGEDAAEKIDDEHTVSITYLYKKPDGTPEQNGIHVEGQIDYFSDEKTVERRMHVGNHTYLFNVVAAPTASTVHQ